MFHKLKVIFLSITVTILIPTSTFAVDASILQMYALNNILGYSDSDCTGSGGAAGTDPGVRYKGSGNEHGHWNGSCGNVNAHSNWILSQIDTVQNIAAENGLPWELLIAQSISEGGGGQAEVCPYNSLGLKKGNYSSCNGEYATFNSYEQMWQAYIDGFIPIREAKNKFPQDPYSAIEFIEYGATHAYAESEIYVQSISTIICGVQEWAKENGYSVSAVSSDSFNLIEASSEAPESSVSSGITNNPCAGKNGASYTNLGAASSIAEQAVRLAWPFNSEDGNDKQDKCDPDGSGNLVTYDGKYDNSVCRQNPKPSYKAAMEQVWGSEEANKGCVSSGGPCDCTRFTTTVILSGGFDPDFPKGNSSVVSNYLANSDKWEEVSLDSLQPGDVLAKPGHTFIYVGDYGGSWGNTAQASQGSSVGVITKQNNFSSPFKAYRLKQ